METRQKFEALPEIATHLNHGNVFFNEEKKTYASEFSSLHIVACYVNGAWMAFQEQENKIKALEKELEMRKQGAMVMSHHRDEVINKCDEIIKSLVNNFQDICDQDKEIIQDYIGEIKELLK